MPSQPRASSVRIRRRDCASQPNASRPASCTAVDERLRPVTLSHVDRVDPPASQALEQDRPRRRLPRVHARDEPDRRVDVSPGQRPLHAAAEPQPAQVVPGGNRDRYHLLRRAPVLQVERQVDVGAAPGVQIGKAGQSRRQLTCRDPPDRPPADRAAVMQHGHAVRGHPHIGLDAGGTHRQRQPERPQRVLGRMRTRAAMGEPEGAGHARQPAIRERNRHATATLIA